MKQFIEEGKIRHWGVSEAAVSAVRRLHAVCPLTSVQNEYSLMFRDPEAPGGLFDTVEELGIGVFSCSPVGRAMLTGAINPDTSFSEGDVRASIPRFNSDNIAHNQQLVRVIEKLAAQKKATCAQIALAWVMHTKPDMVPIPGTTNLARLHKNVGSVAVTLSAEEVKSLSDEAAKMEARGERYPPSAMALVNH